MRVVVIADFAEPSGGAQSVAILSALGLAERDIPVTFIQGVAGHVDRRLVEAGIPVVSLGLDDVWDLPLARAALTGIWNGKAARRLSQALAECSVGETVLHLHLWTRSLSPAVLPVLMGSPHPFAVTLHDYFLACPNGVYYRFDRGEPCGLDPLSMRCVSAPCDPRTMAHKAIRVARSLVVAHLTRRAAFDVIHVSDKGRATLAPFLPRSVRQHRIDNPVDVAPGEPADPTPDAPIVYVGRLTREKGADLAAAAGEAADMPVTFIGEGPAEAEIRRVSPRATLLGWRSRAEVEQILQNGARALVAPSRWYETGPLTVYEAQAAGVPAIVSARAGAAEKIRHGETGLVAEPTIDAMAAAFRVMADASAARAMGRRGYEGYWAAPLDRRVHAERLVGLYGEMLARPA